MNHLLNLKKEVNSLFLFTFCIIYSKILLDSMVIYMLIKEISIDEFNKFTQFFSISSIYQTSEYGIIMNNEGFSPIYIGYFDNNDNILAAALLLTEERKGLKYAYSPNGFLIDYNNYDLLNNFTFELKNFLKKKKIVAVRLNPMIVRNSIDYKNNIMTTNIFFEETLKHLKELKYKHYGFTNFYETIKPRYNAIINLNDNIHIILNNMNINTRIKIEEADKQGIQIIKGNLDTLDYLFDQVKDKYSRDKKYYENILNIFSVRDMVDYYYAKLDTNKYLVYVQKKISEQAKLCSKINDEIFRNRGNNNAELIDKKIFEENRLNDFKNELVYATALLKNRPDGVILSTMLLGKYKDEVTVLANGINKEFPQFNSKYLMIWKFIEKYSKEKYKTFNLGGITNPILRDQRYFEDNEFKLNFNSKCIEYLGDLELVTNNALYTIYKNTKSIKNLLGKNDKAKI